MGKLINNSTKIEGSGAPKDEISSSASDDAHNSNERDERERVEGASIALPSHVAGSGTLDRLVDTARDYAKASTAENTNKAYTADWKHFTRLVPPPWGGAARPGPLPRSAAYWPLSDGACRADRRVPVAVGVPTPFGPQPSTGACRV